MTVYEFVKNYRAEHGMSLRTFSHICGLSHQTVANIEKGVNPSTGETIIPSLQNLKKLAAGMGMTLQDLLNDCDELEVELPAQSAVNPRIPGIMEALSQCTDKQLEDIAMYIDFVRARG